MLPPHVAQQGDHLTYRSKTRNKLVGYGGSCASTQETEARESPQVEARLVNTSRFQAARAILRVSLSSKTNLTKNINVNKKNCVKC